MIKYLLVGALLFSSDCTSNKDHNPDISVLLKDILNDEVYSDRFSGTLCYGSSDSLILDFASGISDRTWGIQTKSDHRFDIASVNKSFFAGLILIAQDEGLLNVSDNLSHHLRGYGFDERITLHQMLTHTSGIPDYDGAPAELQKDGFTGLKRQRFTPDEYVEFISTLDQKFEPGTSFYYSNFAYHLLGIILEKKYNKTFNEILQEKICEPLNLANTYSSTLNEEVHKQLAKGYSYQDYEWRVNAFIDLTLGRRIFSTSRDLFRWGQAISKGELWTSEMAESMTTNHLSGLNENLSYGYGLVVHDGGNYGMGNLDIQNQYLIHGGKTEGYKAMLVIEKNGEFILSFLSNVGDNTNEMEITKTLVKTIINNN
jgi:CubicO group peptidase (beta-lactamase class C family)